MGVLIVVVLLIGLVVYMGWLTQIRSRAAASLAKYNNGRRPDDLSRRLPPVKGVRANLDLSIAKDAPAEIFDAEFFAAGPPAYLCGLIVVTGEYVTLRVDRILAASDLISGKKIEDLAAWLADNAAGIERESKTAKITRPGKASAIGSSQDVRQDGPKQSGGPQATAAVRKNSDSVAIEPVLTSDEIAKLNLKSPLYVIFDEPKSLSALGCWQASGTKYTRVIGYTAFGEIFLQDPTNERYAVFEPQYGRSTATKINDAENFRTAFLTDSEIVERFMRPRDVAALEKRIGALGTDEVYFPVPHLCLGGSGKLESYDKGNLWVYVDLVGQAQGL